MSTNRGAGWKPPPGRPGNRTAKKSTPERPAFRPGLDWGGAFTNSSNAFYAPAPAPGTIFLPPGLGGTTAPNRPTGPTAAQRAASEAAAAMARAGNAYKSQAENLDPQIAALKQAIEKEFKKGLDQNLGDIDLMLKEQFDMLKGQHAERGKDFLATARNNELARGGNIEEGLTNLVRERADTLTAILNQGGSQTDALRAMMGAARNWKSNADEGNRAYFDSLQSINQSITDLDLDTQTALGNIHSSGETERERLWQDYYNRRSESYTELGNLYQQQANYLDLAKENKVGGGGGSKKTASGSAFMSASTEAGKSYKKQGLPDWIEDFEGTGRVEGRATATNLAAAPKFARMRRNQGATLRGRR